MDAADRRKVAERKRAALHSGRDTAADSIRDGLCRRISCRIADGRSISNAKARVPRPSIFCLEIHRLLILTPRRQPQVSLTASVSKVPVSNNPCKLYLEVPNTVPLVHPQTESRRKYRDKRDSDPLAILVLLPDGSYTIGHVLSGDTLSKRFIYIPCHANPCPK